MKHLTFPNNYCLIVGRQGQAVGKMPWNIIFIGKNIVDLNMFYRGGGLVNPLYIYSGTNKQIRTEDQQRIPNLNNEIVNTIAETLSLTLTPEKEQRKGTFAPIDLLDYIYMRYYIVLHTEKNTKNF